MNILIADDSIAMRMMVKRMIKKAGFAGHNLSEAEDGAKALESVKQSKPDLILSDWNMPNMTGLEFLVALNEHDIKVDFGFITTEASQDMRDKAEDAGAKFLISKPFTEDSVRDALAPFLN